LSSSKVEWKEGKDLTKRDEDNQGFFSMWFGSEDQEVELAGIISENLWTDPAKYYFGQTDDLLEGIDGEEGEGEIEGEEGEGEGEEEEEQ